MSATPVLPIEIADLVFRSSEGTLPAKESRTLADWLTDSAKNRSAYVELLGLFAGLEWERGNRAQHLSLANWPSGPAEHSALDELTFPPSTASTLNVERRFSRASRFIGIAASFLLVGYFVTLLGLLAWDRIHRSEERSEFALQISDRPDVLLTRADDAAWQERRNGRVLQVRTGLAELEFAHGAKVVVQGPAEFNVSSPNAGYLHRGSLVAIVPHQAIGFTIETPNAKVVDLGTEFGVEVDAAGQTDVEVITGKVDVHYESSAKPDRSRQTVRMTAGAAKRFKKDAGNGIAVTDVAPKMKGSSAKASLATIKSNSVQDLTSRYPATVLADHPLGYWRLSDVGKDIAADASGHGNSGKYQGFVSRSNPGICPAANDRSARFLGPSFNGCVQIDDFELPASFTVELWARSATPRWNAYGWPLSNRGPHGVIICPVGTSKDWYLLINDASGKQRAVGPCGLENVADRFHHYVGAYDSTSDQAWMYFDGKLVMQGANVLGDDRRRDPVRLKFLIGRDDLGESLDTFGEGWVDEVAIYDHALAADAIERHFNAADVMGADTPAAQVVPGNQ